jgi:ABC-type branched-subunit amino acid transport system ATPase component
MALLEAQGIISGYGGMEILHGVSLKVEPGQIVTIIGPNGAGKSTLLKTIFGLLTLKAGRVTFKRHGDHGLEPGSHRALGDVLCPPDGERLPVAHRPREF